MDRNSTGARRPGNTSRATQGGSASTRPSSGPSVSAPSENSRLADAALGQVEPAQATPEPDLAAAGREVAQGRVDEGVGQTLHRHQRPAGLSAGSQGLAQDPRGEPDIAVPRFGVEGGEQHRMPEPPVEIAVAGHVGADRTAASLRLAGGRPQDPERGEIVPGPAPGDAPRRAHHPPGQPPGIGAQAPALAGREVCEVEGGLVGTGERVGRRADGLEEAQRVGIAGEQQVVAVVEGQAQGRVVVGAAAPARLLGGLVQNHPGPGLGQGDGRGQAGQAGTDDVDDTHQIRPWRRTTPSRASLPGFTRARGIAQPRAITAFR